MLFKDFVDGIVHHSSIINIKLSIHQARFHSSDFFHKMKFVKIHLPNVFVLPKEGSIHIGGIGLTILLVVLGCYLRYVPNQLTVSTCFSPELKHADQGSL